MIPLKPKNKPTKDTTACKFPPYVHVSLNIIGQAIKQLTSLFYHKQQLGVSTYPLALSLITLSRCHRTSSSLKIESLYFISSVQDLSDIDHYCDPYLKIKFDRVKRTLPVLIISLMTMTKDYGHSKMPLEKKTHTKSLSHNPLQLLFGNGSLSSQKRLHVTHHRGNC